MRTNTLSGDIRNVRTRRVRFWTYWIMAVAATLLYLLFTATMLTVPGILSSSKIVMLTAIGTSLAIALGVGMWRFGSTDAPATLWPLGPVSGVVLLLELAHCAVGIFLLATYTHL
jgi:hypothetical protein